MSHLQTLFDARIDLRVDIRAQALFLRSQRNGRLGTWQRDAETAGEVLTIIAAAVVAMVPAKVGPGVEGKVARGGLLQDAPTVRAVTINLPVPDDRVTRAVGETPVETASPQAPGDRERRGAQATIVVVHDRSAPIAITARTVIAEMLQDRTVVTAASVRAMQPSARPSSRSMTVRQFPMTSRRKTSTSMQCVHSMVWPTSSSTGSRDTW